jgi:hypothetical protein
MKIHHVSKVLGKDFNLGTIGSFFSCFHPLVIFAITLQLLYDYFGFHPSM